MFCGGRGAQLNDIDFCRGRVLRTHQAHVTRALYGRVVLCADMSRGQEQATNQQGTGQLHVNQKPQASREVGGSHGIAFLRVNPAPAASRIPSVPSAGAT